MRLPHFREDAFSKSMQKVENPKAIKLLTNASSQSFL